MCATSPRHMKADTNAGVAPNDTLAIDEELNSRWYSYVYHLFKRPGWKDSFRKQVEYLGNAECRITYDVDVKCKTLRERRLSAYGDAAISMQQPERECMPLLLQPNEMPVVRLSARSGDHRELQVMPSDECRHLALAALHGCLIDYSRMKDKYDAASQEARDQFDARYPGIFPIGGIPPITETIAEAIIFLLESPQSIRTTEVLGHHVWRCLESMGASIEDLEAWTHLCSMFEFMHLLLRFINNRLVVVLVDPLEGMDEQDSIGAYPHFSIHVEEVVIEESIGVPWDVRTHLRLKLVSSLVFGLVFCASVLFTGHGAIPTLMVGVIAALLFYPLVSSDLVTGIARWTGTEYRIPLGELGMAEHATVSVSAHEGTVFSPCRRILGDNRLGDGQWAVAEESSGAQIPKDEAGIPSMRYAMSERRIIVSMHEGWNNDDPWAILSSEGEDAFGGARFRKLPYRRQDVNDYQLLVTLRPNSGRRSIGYVVAPMITLLAVCVMWPPSANIFASGNSNDAAAIVSAVIPMACSALAVANEERFGKTVLLGLPRAGWKVSIGVATMSMWLKFGMSSTCSAPVWEALWPAIALVMILAIVVDLLWFGAIRISRRWTWGWDSYNMRVAQVIPCR